LYLSGWLRKLGVSLEAAEELVNELVKDDEEKTIESEPYMKHTRNKI
jgi:hypothetical protein